MVIVMERGRFSGSYWKDDNNALLQHLAQLDRSAVDEAEAERKLRALERRAESRPGGDFAAPRDERVPEWRSSPEMRALVAGMKP